jgi:GT2 family glycosyltransferase
LELVSCFWFFGEKIFSNEKVALGSNQLENWDGKHFFSIYKNYCGERLKMVSTIILAYNRCAEVLLTIDKMKALLSALPLQTEIIVVDNASIDDTSSKIKELHPDIVLVRKNKNNGIAGWNAGFEVGRCKYFLVLDDDSHVETGLIEAINYLEENPKIGILALNVATGPYRTEQWGWKDGEKILGFFGCGAIIRKEVFNKIGGFAEWLYVYAHEWEYGIRCLDAGYEIRYFEKSKVIHRANVEGRSFKRLRVFCTRNEMGIVYKYFGENRWKILKRMWFNNLKHVMDGAFLHTWYNIVGSFKFLKWRKTLQQTPVSQEVQDFFAANYDNTRPFFYNMSKKLTRTLRKISNS